MLMIWVATAYQGSLGGDQNRAVDRTSKGAPCTERYYSDAREAPYSSYLSLEEVRPSEWAVKSLKCMIIVTLLLDL